MSQTGNGTTKLALLMSSVLGLAVSACDASSTSGPDPALRPEIKASAAPAPSNAAVFGFEVAGVWSTTTSGATLAQSTKHSEGLASLSVRPGSNSYISLVSVPLTTLTTVSPTLAVDVMLPRNQPNPNWYGTFQVYLNCPSRAIYSQFLGQIELTGKPREAWDTLNFTVNNTMLSGLLRAGYSDLVITLALNVPTPNAETYYLDNLRFVPVSARGCNGLPNGTACNDGNACTTGDSCQANACVPKGAVACAAPDQCHTGGTCDPNTGVCQYPTKADGSACDDGNACTQSDTCQAGTCKGASPVVCTASDQCHDAGMCDPKTGACGSPSKPDGTSCDDGSVCTVGDTCKAGVCTGGSPLNCDDGLTCTVDTCDPKAGCVHTGNCPRPCGGIAGLTCAAGEFCSFGVGTCQVADNMGVCQPIPQICPTVYDPVCGCNGQTYANQCAADMAGAAVDHTGACVQICGTIAGLTCPHGEYCAFPKGTCQVADAKGECQASPEACPETYIPVCGCDGYTYPNECEAARSGVSVIHDGECPTVCGGLAGVSCPTGEFCSFADGSCRTSDVTGVCTAIPSVCPDVYQPVCGCDGKTYPNACTANLNGQSVDQTGECR